MTGTAINLDDQVSPYLQLLLRQALDAGEMTAAMAGYILFSTQRRFETETGPDGQAWKPLAKRTTLRKIRGGRRGSLNMLRLSTRLYRSLVQASDATSAEVGTNVIYAAIHQFGGTIQLFARSQKATFKKLRGGRQRFVKRGTKGGIERAITIGEHSVTIPARPYLGFSSVDIAEMEAIGQQYLTGGAS